MTVSPYSILKIPKTYFIILENYMALKDWHSFTFLSQEQKNNFLYKILSPPSPKKEIIIFIGPLLGILRYL